MALAVTKGSQASTTWLNGFIGLPKLYYVYNFLKNNQTHMATWCEVPLRSYFSLHFSHVLPFFDNTVA